MRNVRMVRTEANFLSIPAEKAVYCENCETVSNSANGRCGVCGSEAITNLLSLIDGPPPGPESGPAPAAHVIPPQTFERLRAA
jgi:hypothetical protein